MGVIASVQLLYFLCTLRAPLPFECFESLQLLVVIACTFTSDRWRARLPTAACVTCPHRVCGAQIPLNSSFIAVISGQYFCAILFLLIVVFLHTVTCNKKCTKTHNKNTNNNKTKTKANG